MNSALLEEACDVFFGAGRPSKRRAVIHQLSGHNERVPPFQLTVIPLAVMMNSKTAFQHNQYDQLRYYHNLHALAVMVDPFKSWFCKKLTVSLSKQLTIMSVSFSFILVMVISKVLFRRRLTTLHLSSERPHRFWLIGWSSMLIKSLVATEQHLWDNLLQQNSTAILW